MQQASNGNLLYFQHAFFHFLCWGHCLLPQLLSPLFIEATGSKWHLPSSYMIPHLGTWLKPSQSASFLGKNGLPPVTTGAGAVASSCVPDCIDFLTLARQHRTHIQKGGKIYEIDRKWETEGEIGNWEEGETKWEREPEGGREKLRLCQCEGHGYFPGSGFCPGPCLLRLSF